MLFLDARDDSTYPTGRLANVIKVAIGNTGALVEEWSWRLEAMRAGRAVTP
jgi:hypothetical protein